MFVVFLGRRERHFPRTDHTFYASCFVQARGYIGRYCTYTGDGFQEGVSLTAADEVIRLRKYAYGSCEIMLNKFTVGRLFHFFGIVLYGIVLCGRHDFCPLSRCGVSWMGLAGFRGEACRRLLG